MKLVLWWQRVICEIFIQEDACFLHTIQATLWTSVQATVGALRVFSSCANNILKLRCAKCNGTYDRVMELYRQRHPITAVRQKRKPDSSGAHAHATVLLYATSYIIGHRVSSHVATPLVPTKMLNGIALKFRPFAWRKRFKMQLMRKRQIRQRCLLLSPIKSSNNA